jgi:hypothetical protein
MIEKRPLGVSILAGAAFLASVALFVALIFALKNLAVAIGQEDDSGGGAVLVLTFCLIALAWTSGAAGMELWKLRSRGRTLTVVSMCIFSLLGLALAADEARGILLWAGPTVCALSAGGIVYLFLPNIRRKFEADTHISPLIPADPRWGRVVALTSLASGFCIIAAALIRLSESVDWIQGLAVLSAFWLPYFFIPARMRGEKIKSGFTLAIAMGSALFLPGVALLYHVHEWEKSWWIQGSLFFALVMQPILVVAALRAYKSLPKEPQDRSKAAVSGAHGVLLFGLFWFIVVFGNFPSPITYNESEAMESMRNVYMTADRYSKAHQGFFPDNSINPGTDEKEECANDRPPMYRHEASYGYIIAYQSMPAEKLVDGCRVAASYTGTAQPVNYGKTGRRSFFVDHTKVIRFTSENRAATSRDPELPTGSLPPLSATNAVHTDE